MASLDKSILVIGESDVGKSHYGGQLLKRLMQEDGQVRMDGAATNLEPFQAVMACLDAGLAAGHTPTASYQDSRWPIIVGDADKADLIWPDYGGEQIKNIIDERRLPHVWLQRITASSACLLLIRLQKLRTDDDIFSRPVASLMGRSRDFGDAGLSDQARLVELLQVLVYMRTASVRGWTGLPRLVILLTCWDEMERPATPLAELYNRLPMFADFLAANWPDYLVFGLSALGRALDSQEPDEEYTTKGAERFGYVVLEDGTRSADLTLPVRTLVRD